MQSPFNPYMGMASRSQFYDMLATPLLGGDTNTNGLGTNAGPQNDSMFGGVTDQQAQSAFGSDFMGKNDPAFSTNPGGPSQIGPGMGKAPPGQQASAVPGLPSFNGQPAPAVADLGMTSPTDTGSLLNDPMVNDLADKTANLNSKSMSDVGPGSAAAAAAAAEAAGPAGVPGSEQNSPNAVGGLMGGEMAATGTTPGVGGEHSMGGGGGGGGDGGGGMGGPGPGDHGGGQGVGGTSGSENGQGHYAKGGRITHQSPFMVDPNPHNADDMPIEAQRDEHVVTVKASKGLGRKFLDTANKEFAKKGADRKAILKKLAPLMGKD